MLEYDESWGIFAIQNQIYVGWIGYVDYLPICNVWVLLRQLNTMEKPEEPVRHNVAGNGKRDGAKAEKS